MRLTPRQYSATYYIAFLLSLVGYLSYFATDRFIFLSLANLFGVLCWACF